MHPSGDILGVLRMDNRSSPLGDRSRSVPTSSPQTRPPCIMPTPSDASDQQSTAATEMWRDGEYLVVRPNRVPSAHCLACNKPAARQVKYRLWESGDVSRNTVLWMVFGALAIFAHESATLRLPLCGEHYQGERRYRTRLNVLLLAAIVVAFGMTYINACYYPVSDVVNIPGFLLALIAFGSALVVRLRHRRLFTAPKVTRQFVWLANVSPAILDSCPSVNADADS